jgi:hypothetical protein
MQRNAASGLFTKPSNLLFLKKQLPYLKKLQALWWRLEFKGLMKITE